MKKDRIVIYCLTSKEDQDEQACKNVLNFLKPFFRNSEIPIDIISDYEFDELGEIEKHKEKLYEADLVFAFGSNAFIADDNIYERLKKVIALYNEKKLKIVGILTRNFMWDEKMFNQLPIFPKDPLNRPLLDETQWNSDLAYTTLAQELKVEIKNYFLE